MSASWILKIILDYVVIKITPGDFFDYHNIFIYVFFMILNGVFMGLIIPIVLKNNQVLLKYEYLFLEDFKEI